VSAPAYAKSTLSVVLALLALRAAVFAAPMHLGGPCPACITSLPDGADPRPLLVLLHGDGETASMMMGEWGREAEARRIALLALQCPPSLGCTSRSWWKWDMPVGGFIEKQVDAVKRMRPIDENRMWVVGWSGGATYIGWRTQEFERLFSAIVIHGGGMPPPSGSRCAARPSPVYFLVGDSNPLHSFAVDLKNYYTSCRNDLVWTLLPHADHQAERHALGAHRKAILDWLESR
jgi:poly(3-hydroxybutyrate) depolymerase